MPLSPNVILQNRYIIIELIGRGGMGAVYKAIDQRLGNTVALKQTTVRSPHLREAFENEACLLASLQHPALPVVSDHFTEGDDKFLVMQYISGDDLGTMLMNETERFPISDVLRWADQLLDALDYLHSQKPPIIHRDIKPRNLKLNPRGDVILLDFGLAKGSQMIYAADGAGRNVRILTPEYAPLEQIQGTDSDPRSDLCSLAATLYHLLTGKAPSDALTRAASVLSEQTDPLRPSNELNPQIPPAIAVILHQAMSHSLEQRFANARAMRTALKMVYSSGGDGPGGKDGNSLLLDSSGQTTLPIVERKRLVAETPSPGLPEARLPLPVVVVAKEGGGNYRTIGEAITRAGPGTRILVRPGVYREHLVIDRSVEIIGDGPREDIFIESTTSVCLVMQTEYALVRGLTLRGRAGLEQREYVTVDIPTGRLVLEECDLSSDTLACIAIHGSNANPVIWRCQIHDSRGGGVLVYDHGQGVVEDCDIFGNAGAGVEIRQIGNPIIRRCKIHHGERDGVYVTEKGAGLIESCDIFGNVRAGVSIHRQGNPFIRLCRIHDQVNGYGVYVYDKGEGTLEGCNIFGNSKAGVGITQGGDPFLRRCRIHHEKHRGVFIFEHGEGTLEKCSILGNFDTGISIGQGSTPVIRRCRINQNGSQAIRVLPRGGGKVEECDLTGNTHGAWDIAAKCQVTRSENKE